MHESPPEDAVVSHSSADALANPSGLISCSHEALARRIFDWEDDFVPEPSDDGLRLQSGGETDRLSRAHGYAGKHTCEFAVTLLGSKASRSLAIHVGFRQSMFEIDDMRRLLPSPVDSEPHYSYQHLYSSTNLKIMRIPNCLLPVFGLIILVAASLPQATAFTAPAPSPLQGGAGPPAPICCCEPASIGDAHPFCNTICNPFMVTCNVDDAAAVAVPGGCKKDYGPSAVSGACTNGGTKTFKNLTEYVCSGPDRCVVGDGGPLGYKCVSMTGAPSPDQSVATCTGSDCEGYGGADC